MTRSAPRAPSTVFIRQCYYHRRTHPPFVTPPRIAQPRIMVVAPLAGAMGGVLRLSDFEALPLYWLWPGRILIGPYSSFAYKYFIRPDLPLLLSFRHLHAIVGLCSLASTRDARLRPFKKNCLFVYTGRISRRLWRALRYVERDH